MLKVFKLLNTFHFKAPISVLFSKPCLFSKFISFKSDPSRKIMLNGNERVLSIQSHVVSGYVGNKSAVFPLEVLGFEVDSINTVQLSNHTGYPHFKGQILCSDDLKILCDGLRLNNIFTYSHLLTGYIGSVSFANEIVNTIKELKTTNPNLYFVCDPVMGDNGKMYVPKELLPVYRDQIVPLANLLTPNQFEAELLTGITIKTENDALTAMKQLHSKGVEAVLLSSAKFNSSDKLTILGSSNKGGELSFVKMQLPQLPTVFTGTGDLLASTLLGWMAKTNYDLKLSSENAVNTVQNVIHRTLSYAKEHAGPDGELTPRLLELKLIASKADIEQPKTFFSATVLENRS